MQAGFRMAELPSDPPFLTPVVDFWDNQTSQAPSPLAWWSLQKSASTASTHFSFTLHSFSHLRICLLNQLRCLFSLCSPPTLGTRGKHLERRIQNKSQVNSSIGIAAVFMRQDAHLRATVVPPTPNVKKKKKKPYKNLKGNLQWILKSLYCLSSIATTYKAARSGNISPPGFCWWIVGKWIS